MLPKEVFLWHSSKDRDFATNVAELLRRHGIPVWYSRTNIIGAQEWHDEIGAALHRCNWFVIVLSPNTIRSTWTKNELLFALNHPRYKSRIVQLKMAVVSFCGSGASVTSLKGEVTVSGIGRTG
jgi:hypothetical protein